MKKTPDQHILYFIIKGAVVICHETWNFYSESIMIKMKNITVKCRKTANNFESWIHSVQKLISVHNHWGQNFHQKFILEGSFNKIIQSFFICTCQLEIKAHMVYMKQINYVNKDLPNRSSCAKTLQQQQRQQLFFYFPFFAYKLHVL